MKSEIANKVVDGEGFKEDACCCCHRFLRDNCSTHTGTLALDRTLQSMDNQSALAGNSMEETLDYLARVRPVYQPAGHER